MSEVTKAWCVKAPGDGQLLLGSVDIDKVVCRQSFSIRKYGGTWATKCLPKGYQCVPVEIKEVKA